MTNIPSSTLNSGMSMPMIAYGLGGVTMSRTHEDVAASISAAIKSGYYHIDAAEAYGNEAVLGDAINDSNLSRETLFITTKVLGTPGQDIEVACDASLQKLKIDYVDLYLIHLPHLAPDEIVSMWKTMEKIQISGRARSIGVSNFVQRHLEKILAVASITPAVNQIEYHPYLQHGDLVQFYQKAGITVSAYGTLTAITKAAPGPVDDVYTSLAQKYSVTRGDIAMRWCIEQDIAVVMTSSSEERLQRVAQKLWSFRLAGDEVDELSRLSQQKHYHVLYNKWFAGDDRS
ncbi:Aldo/keto reductase [Xylariaceae sp. FL0255]|nr:Aldo/keto reductase [Xylariaceae sp. FL0255]